jgi:hypothetical protein
MKFHRFINKLKNAPHRFAPVRGVGERLIAAQRTRHTN